MSCHIKRLCSHLPSRKTSPAVSSAVEALTLDDTSGAGTVGCAPKYFNSVPEKITLQKCIVDSEFMKN